MKPDIVVLQYACAIKEIKKKKLVLFTLEQSRSGLTLPFSIALESNIYILLEIEDFFP